VRSAEWNETSDSSDVADSALGRAFAVLDSFGSDESSVSLSELSRRTGLPKATMHRILYQLCLLNVVERTPNGYQLGMRLFELGARPPRSRDLREAVSILGDLRDATHETVHLAVLDDGDVLYIEKLVGHNGPPLASRVGGKLPAHCTGVGKALLAFGPRESAEAVLRSSLRRMTPRTIVLPGPLSRELVKIRRDGVAYEFEESTLGVVCVACPVMGANGVAEAAISLTGWTHSFDPVRFAPAVRTAALAISRQLAQTHTHRLPRRDSPSTVPRRTRPRRPSEDLVQGVAEEGPKGDCAVPVSGTMPEASPESGNT